MADRQPKGRERQPTIEQLLDQQLQAFDQLMGEVRGGIRSPVHYDQLEASARTIGRSVIDAFRKGRP